MGETADWLLVQPNPQRLRRTEGRSPSPDNGARKFDVREPRHQRSGDGCQCHSDQSGSNAGMVSSPQRQCPFGRSVDEELTRAWISFGIAMRRCQSKDQLLSLADGDTANLSIRGGMAAEYAQEASTTHEFVD
jgi:hypothetical protein